MDRKVTLAVIAFVLVIVMLLAVSFGFLTSMQQISNVGQITSVGVGVYLDQACTANLTSINWGNVDSGASVVYVAYLKDTGNSNISLSLVESNWVPASASQVLTLSWNAPATLQPGQVVAVTFSLVAAANTGTVAVFSFSVNVTGTAP